MAAQADFDGKVIRGEAWVDANGKNFVIITEKRIEHKDYSRSTYLYAYHYANKGEITFVYRLGCDGDPTPVPMKLMMLEDGDKYAIRGTTSLEMYNHVGEMNVDASFNDAPDEFLPFAKKIWESDREYFNKFNE
jgi:hypothetical protein